MNFILLSYIKYFTKEIAKIIRLVLIGSSIILTVVCIKYKPAYKVTIEDETIAYVSDKDVLEAKVNKYIEDTSNNIAFREIEALPQYEFKLISRRVDTSYESEKTVMLAVNNLTTTTYKFYAITANGEQKSIVTSQEEAENIVSALKQDLDEKVELEFGIVDVYTTENTFNSSEEANSILNEIKVAKVTEYEEKKAEEERQARIAAQRAMATKYAAATSTTVSTGPVGSVNGMSFCVPVSGSISSRFGARGSRSYTHTGLDLATSAGTGIRPAAAGTVVFAAYKGSYGNLIIVDHGNGVQTYYAHCSALYVSAGQSVDTGTTIGAVGSTGNSTGPHLHFEIRINGTPVNPEGYLF